MYSKTDHMKPLAIIIALALLSCNNTSETTRTEIKPTTDTAQRAADSLAQSSTGAQAACYLAVDDRDTIRLQLTINDSLVSGKMQYDNYQVDGNIGTVQALKQGGRISGHFTFFAEGMWSVREIIFEERNGQLLQASTNNMSYGKDTMRFTNTQNLAFDEDRPFKPVPCSTLQFPQLPPQNVSSSF